MKAIIFDLDGVLVFTDKFHYQAWKKMADSMNIYFDEEINNRLRGVSRAQSLEIILERYTGIPLSEADKEKLMEYKNDIYKDLLKTMTPEMISEDTRSALNALKKAGHKLAIGSSSKNTKYILKQTALDSYFDAVSDGTNISRSKPDPEVFLKAAAFLGEPSENCVVVEDAFAGIDAAKAAGMTAVGIGDASRYEKADFTISHLAELIEITK